MDPSDFPVPTIPKQLLDLRFGRFVAVSVAFAGGDVAVIVSYRTATNTILDQVERFLRGAQSAETLSQDAVAMADAFARFQVEVEGESSEEIALSPGWSQNALVRVTVDLDRTTAAGIPIVKARAASLVNAAGDPWTEDQPRDEAQLAWVPTY